MTLDGNGDIYVTGYFPLTIGGTDIGTMSGEIRGKDGRIDIKATIDSLVKMGVNTYYYLVWHNVHDWDDFPAFNKLAAAHGISVWVYVIHLIANLILSPKL